MGKAKQKRRLSILKEPLANESIRPGYDKRRRVSFGTSNQLITYEDRSHERTESATVSFQKVYVPLNDINPKSNRRHSTGNSAKEIKRNTTPTETKSFNLSDHVTIRDTPHSTPPPNEDRAQFIRRFFRPTDIHSDEDNSTMEITTTFCPIETKAPASKPLRRKDSLAFSSPETDLQKMDAFFEKESSPPKLSIESEDLSQTTNFSPLKTISPFQSSSKKLSQTTRLNSLISLSKAAAISNHTTPSQTLFDLAFPTNANKISGQPLSPAFLYLSKGKLANLEKEFLEKPCADVLRRGVTKLEAANTACEKDLLPLEEKLSSLRLGEGLEGAMESLGKQCLASVLEEKSAMESQLNADAIELLGRSSDRLEGLLKKLNAEAADVYLKALDATVEMEKYGGRKWLKLKTLIMEKAQIARAQIKQKGEERIAAERAKEEKELQAEEKKTAELVRKLTAMTGATPLPSKSSLKTAFAIGRGVFTLKTTFDGNGARIEAIALLLDLMDKNGVIEMDKNGVIEMDKNGVIEMDKNGFIERDKNGVIEMDKNGVIEMDKNGVIERNKNLEDCGQKLNLGRFDLLLESVFSAFDWKRYLNFTTETDLRKYMWRITFACETMAALIHSIEKYYCQKMGENDPPIIAVNRSVLVPPPLGLFDCNTAYFHFWLVAKKGGHFHFWVDVLRVLDVLLFGVVEKAQTIIAAKVILNGGGCIERNIQFVEMERFDWHRLLWKIEEMASKGSFVL